MPKSDTSRRRRQLVPLAVAADAFSISTKTLRRRISDGSLTGYRHGRKLIRVDLAEVDALFHRIPSADGGGRDA